MRGEEVAYDDTWYRIRKRLPHEVVRMEEYRLRGGPVSQKVLFQVLGTLIPEGSWKGPKWLYTAVIRRVYLYSESFFHRKVWRGKRQFDLVVSGIEGLPEPGESPGIMVTGWTFAVKHFQDIADELREEFVPRQIDAETARMAEGIKENAVCIHVRVTDDGVIPDPGYYEGAIAMMDERVVNPQYFVFSNHAEHAKKLLELPDNAVFIEPGDAVQDLYLMSKCHHHIIAESTYSWCGAWLGEKPGQIVMYPKGWSFEREPRKLTLDRWIPIEGMRYMAAADGR